MCCKRNAWVQTLNTSEISQNKYRLSKTAKHISNRLKTLFLIFELDNTMMVIRFRATPMPPANRFPPISTNKTYVLINPFCSFESSGCSQIVSFWLSISIFCFSHLITIISLNYVLLHDNSTSIYRINDFSNLEYRNLKDSYYVDVDVYVLDDINVSQFDSFS